MQEGKKSLEIFDASNYKVGLVCTNFNVDIIEKIKSSALEKLKEYQVKEENIDIYTVAGSVEIPVLLQSLSQKKKHDCLVAIGTVIKGETDHYQYVCKMVSDGVMRAMLDNTMSIGFAVLTTQNRQLAEERVSLGAEAVVAALHNARLIKE
ncbi:MAG: 6,7-dimethyl-8-ribityllumazine synthase [Candidatus Magasanikbacteria bacterium CG_4_10_14_0_8_um_filter_32_14]|uniref:6,7-dimethyl-8-ribityllumazine synthase n=2 Tax=Candidatus Magasanikiibacteriota TaxID=1752731 RepID=A0A2M7RB12_9BACT|nr:MAG: 6,7-dimethyl-8-ribityllumazine synthase [Candidatus Magasanikbacteria bacterium CG1_02_32_51]PIY93692.1 MAG: 6,7-dimethyl-8-ribityllumazine synthase [Candidatus Magasanikbacteria bacterium CG_4_10_14_0_8_um_filter_32_14]